jgi:multiple sugar transport system permease protein
MIKSILKKEGWCEIAFWCGVTAIVTIAVFPIVWMVITSLKMSKDIFGYPPLFLFKPYLGNYWKIIVSPTGYPKFLLNSVIVAMGSTSLVLILATPAAYVFARFQFKFRRDLMFWILTTRMMPPAAVIIPFFLIFNLLGLMDTHQGLISAHTLFNLGLATWLLTGYFRDLPKELEDSAMVDGCSRQGAFVRIVIPLTAPGIAATAILCFIFSWNEFLFALILTGVRAKTMPVGLTGFWTTLAVIWGELAAGSIIAVIPVFVFALLVQRHLVRGLTLGALK